ncbi:MAG: glutathione S-transferase [Alphaproteobacteria bacterium]|nr:glutathione S-transferase [Alphaproteobacteria bacterium]
MSASYTLVIGNKDWSSWSLRPWLALKMIGVPFTEDLIRLRHDSTTEEVQRRSPSGRVPVLQITEGGETYEVWDSLAICETLADRHPEARLWPDSPKLKAMARAYAAEMHSGFADVREQLTMDFARKLPTPALRDATKAQIARILKSWGEALSANAKDGGFLFGRFSIADCMYAPVCSRFRTYGILMPKECEAYVERMFALSAMGEWLAAAQDEINRDIS